MINISRIPPNDEPDLVCDNRSGDYEPTRWDIENEKKEKKMREDLAKIVTSNTSTSPRKRRRVIYVHPETARRIREGANINDFNFK